jgi:cytochrome oxidase Cu insertion factor (SCO1/SenC/PrrC family)
MKKISGLAALLLLGGVLAGCLRVDGTLVSVSPEMAAPPIKGEDSKDQPFQLSDYRGKVVLLKFWRST